ncbi:TonB family protein [Chitinophaga sedimenti]|uniref:TonB family protein n=1 Tax=Chitinophaga sedimenti TaxID=2033606 RepID=UPI0020036EDE|nr:energy transducer TonB [Chitinophaga sedimenti]MCK7556946.1 TonB family protein [Chitinophaga sedimenti]
MAMGNAQFTLTNNFFHPPIKRRIIMLTQSKQPKFSYLRRVMILPLGAVIFASLSFVVDKNDIADLKAALTPAPKPVAVAQVQETPVQPAFSSTAMKKVEAAKPTFVAVNGDKLEGVVSSKSGKPVKNATILVKGTQSGTISESNGSFSLDGLPDNATIVVSSIGFVTREIPLKKGTSNILIQLERETKEVGEVVVVGYGAEGDYAPEDEPQEPAKKKEVFTFVEQPPKYPGGTQELNRYMARNIRYPHAAVKGNITGTVFVTFVVDEQGNITEVNTVGKPRGGGLEEEAMRVVKGMPKWEPGRQNGQTVSVQFNLPVKFQLQKETKPKQQTTTTAAPKQDANEVYTFVQQPPKYPGGESELHKYLSKNIRYPHDAVEKGSSGTVFVSFVVQKTAVLPILIQLAQRRVMARKKKPSGS